MSERFTYVCSETRRATAWEEIAPFHDANDTETWWLDVTDATKEDVTAISRSLSLHPLTIEDIILHEPRQKIETFPDYYLISLRTLSEPDIEMNYGKLPMEGPTMIYILVFSSGTVTFSSGCRHAARVQSRIARLHDRSVLSSDWICYAIMYVPFNISGSDM